ncbi:MAG TPA: protein kinase [Pyrinomonadaceae bacterium]|nr:protein kinase [Pyrinomonadaceae bacterium]
MLTKERLAQEIKELPADRIPGAFDIEEETTYLASVVNAMLKDRLKDYKYLGVAGAGAAGTVLIFEYERLGASRAAKLPRKRLEESHSTESPVDIVKELDALAKVSHQNIVRYYDSFEIEPGKYCILMELMSEFEPLDGYVKAVIRKAGTESTDEAIERSLRAITDRLAEIASALQYLHEEAKLLHFDVKPGNILIPKSDRAFLTDFGFARALNEYGEDEDVVVGFTYRYAHPKLTDVYRGARVSQSPAKAHIKIKGKDLTPKFDLFAFARTIQEVLHLFEMEFGERVHANYHFKFLHFVACLMLDGRNLPPSVTEEAPPASRGFVADTALNCPPNIFAAHRFDKMTQVCAAFSKLRGTYRIEDDLPELDVWYPHTLNASDLGIVSMPSRVKRIIHHPLFARLEDEKQLGLLGKVFPTATHTRQVHSIGVHYATARYISALYYDPDSPIFRILFDKDQGRRVLLATLVHDLGQTTLGHDVEEVDEKIFSHEAFTRALLADPMPGGKRARTIAQLATGSAADEWAVPLEKLLGQFEGKAAKPFDTVLNQLLDGQMDTDKTDYLLRDTVDSRVSYGYGIDFERFLRALTVVPIQTPDAPALGLGIKMKGKASAEAFAFARYQLYQSIYLHHTYRAMKAMLLTGASAALNDLFARASEAQATPLLPIAATLEQQLSDSFFRYVLRNNRDAVPRREKKTLPELVAADLAKNENTIFDLGDSVGRTLHYFHSIANSRSRKLMEDLIQRRVYKRAFEMPLARLTDESLNALRQNLEWERRVKATQALEEAFVAMLIEAVKQASEIRESIVEPEITGRITDIVAQRHGMLVDAPFRGIIPKGISPRLIPDYTRRYFSDGVNTLTTPNAIMWKEIVPHLMREVSMLRIYIERDLHEIITTVMPSGQVHAAIVQGLKDHLGVEFRDV